MRALHEELTANKVRPELHEGEVTLWHRVGGERKPYACDGSGDVDDHPDGSDRGGYVLCWQRPAWNDDKFLEKVYYCESHEEWFDW